MFKVECPGCKAPYQVDERRIPPNGLKMRCPKCGTSFKVDPPSDPQRTGPSPVLGAVFGLGADSVPPPPAAPLPRAGALKSTMVGVAPAAPSADRGKAPEARPAPPAPSSHELDLDLPSPAPPVGLPAPVDKPSAPKRPAPPPPRRTSPSTSDTAADLPAPARPKLAADLPSPAAARKPAAPLAPPRAPAPAPLPLPQAPSRAEADLPALPKRPEVASARPSSRAFGEIELDLPSPAAPSPRAPTANFGGIDLPSPARADLPDVRAVPDRSIDLPELASELPSAVSLDLPDIAASRAADEGGIDLPSLGGAGLPSPSQAGLPSVGSSGLPMTGGPGLPSPAVAGFPSNSSRGSLPAPEARAASLPSPNRESSNPGRARQGLDSFGELDLPLITGQGAAPKPASEPLESDPFGEAVLPPPRSLAPAKSAAPADAGLDFGTAAAAAAAAAVVRQQGGGISYGEVNLSSGEEADVALDAPARPPLRSEEDMEFGGVPQEAEARLPAPKAHVAAHVPPTPGSVRPPGTRRKAALKVFIPLFVVLVGGASLALVPSVGPFGAYWIHDRVRAGEYEKLVSDTVAKARRRLQVDTFSEAKASLRDVDSARSQARRVRALAAYGSLLGFARELRFGPDPEAHARAKVLLDELEGMTDVPYAELARAARAATEGQLARARQLLAGPLRSAPRDPDALALKGEVELRAKDSKAALTAWTSLAAVESSARAAFGLARARFAAGDTAAAERDATEALKRNPAHLGARILVARIASANREREAAAVDALSEIAKQAASASPDELVQAQTLLGDIHLSRSRISKAEAAYTEALKINPKAARALVGLGESLYRAGRYSEAQARFEAGAQADPDDVLAKVGVAKSKLMLERVEEAHASLKKLHDSHAASVSAAYWYGRVLEALGNREEAERIYRKTIEKGSADPALVDAYIALALLQNQQGRSDDARKTLQAAREKLPSSSAIHRALGEVALARGNYTEAQGEFQKAIGLDSEDVAARFKLGVAFRRDGKFDEASKIFEEVKAIDRDYPGLALEHGLLYEAAGRTEEALKAYEGALAKAPNDPDLMLRVGCGYASAGRTKEAQQLLREVLGLRPTSAETNHCMGRALLAEGSRLADALRYLDRAVELDPHRAENHLYVGWAANEAGNVPKAERALDEAIKLDQSLADAYWQRGVLRSRQGAVRDAIADLTRALQLRPSRYEAHAALADAYYDFGKEALALAEWRKAVGAKPENATWHFRYGKLLAANQMNEAARAELTAAIDLAEKSSEGERWLWEAHHLLARVIGPRAESIRHWEQFLKLGPLDSPYRAEAQRTLQMLGRPWTGN